MRLHALIVLSIGSALAYGATALAQQPAPSASPPPAAAAAPPDYGPPITNDQAKAAAAAAFAEAKASVEIAQAKARTAVLFRRPSKVFADQYAAGNTAFTTFPEKPVASEGGVPITVNGKIIGAIGVSGGTGQQDGVAAAAGVSAAR